MAIKIKIVRDTSVATTQIRKALWGGLKFQAEVSGYGFTLISLWPVDNVDCPSKLGRGVALLLFAFYFGRVAA